MFDIMDSMNNIYTYLAFRVAISWDTFCPAKEYIWAKRWLAKPDFCRWIGRPSLSTPKATWIKQHRIAHDCSWLSFFHHTRYQKNGVEWSRTVLQHISLRHFTSKTHWHDIAWLHGIFTALTVFPTKWLPFQRTAKHLRLREVSLIASAENVLLHRKRAWMQFPAIPRTISQSCDFGVQSRD